MSQIMGLIRSKLCIKLGEVGGQGERAAFNSSQLFADALKRQACLHPRSDSLRFSKVREETEREPRAVSELPSIEASANESCSITTLFLPPAR